MCLYLSETANRILLDNAFSQTRLTLNSTIDALDKIPAPNVMSADSSGNPTSAGYLLHHVTSSLANATEISKAGIKSYLDLFSSLLAMTLAGSGGKRTLGQITYAFTTPTDGMLVPEITRGIWSILCTSCSHIQACLQPDYLHVQASRGVRRCDDTLTIVVPDLVIPLTCSSASFVCLSSE